MSQRRNPALVILCHVIKRFILGLVSLACIALLLLPVVGVAADKGSPQAELESLMRTASQARQTGDPVIISQANRKLLAFALAQMAGLKTMQGDAATAADLFGRSLEFENDFQRRSQYVVALNAVGKLDEALQQTEIMLQQDPNSALAWGMKGRLLTKQKKYQEAADALSKSLAIEFDPEAAYVMASDFLYLRQADKAEAVFQQLEKAGIPAGRVHVLAGRAYEEADFPEAAEREFKQAIELDPKSQGHYFLGLFYLSHNGWEPTPKAREQFAAEVAANPTDFFGNYFLGFLASGDKDYDTSDKYLKVAAQARPDWPEPFLYMGLNAYGRGDNQAAEELLRKAIQLTGSDEGRNNYQIRRAYFTLGRILIQSGRKEEGVKLVEKSKAMETKLLVDSRTSALDKKSASPETALEGRGNSNTSTVDTKPAAVTPEQKEQIAKAENALSGILGNSYNDLGTSEARRQDYATALLHFQQAQRWSPEMPGLERNIGLAAFLSANYEECARVLQGVVEREPSDRRSQSMLALSLYMIKSYAEAAKAFDRVPDEATADPRMSYAWAYTLWQIKQPGRAMELLGKWKEQPLPPEMFVRMGKLYSDLGDQADAQQCFQKAREQDPNIKVPQ